MRYRVFADGRFVATTSGTNYSVSGLASSRPHTFVLAALDQRIAVRYALAGMTPADTADYIGHHAKVAGRTDPLFSDDAITVIHNAARGYPRAVNNLALHALTAAFAAKTAIVDEKSARIAVTETGHD